VEETGDPENQLETIKMYDPNKPISSEWETDDEESEPEQQKLLKSIVKRPPKEDSPKLGCSRQFDEQDRRRAEEAARNHGNHDKVEAHVDQNPENEPGANDIQRVPHPLTVYHTVPQKLQTVYIPTGYTARGIIQAELKQPYT